MPIITEQQYRVSTQHNRELFARISILDSNDYMLDRIEGYCLDGTIDINNDSSIQRTCSLNMLLINKLLINQYNLVWTNKRFKLEIGIKDILTDEIVWFNQGIFLYQTTDITYSPTDKNLSIKGLDKMCLLTGDLGGILTTKLLINKGTPITQAIRSTVTDLGLEHKILIDNILDDNGNLRVIPYDIEKAIGDTIYDLLDELIKLYRYNVIYYNVDGYFVAEKTKTLLNDPVVINFDDLDFSVSHQLQHDFTFIKNDIRVLGQTVEPLICVEDMVSTTTPSPQNGANILKIYFNKPLYNQNNVRFTNGQDITNCFQYSGTANNYTKAIYNDTDWSITFTITGENGKIISPKDNMIHDFTGLKFNDGGFVYSTKDTKWSKLLSAIVLTDGTTDAIRWSMSFNKPLYNSSGTAIATGTSLKNYFTYSGANASNFLDAIYNNDNNGCYILFTFSNAIENTVIQTNQNVIFDSAGLPYPQERFIMNGGTWSRVINTPCTDYQISYTLQNTDINSPYCISKIGYRTYIVNDETIFTIDQAKIRCEYELETHSNLNEKLSITCIPLYFLNINQLININREEIGVSGKYQISRISFGLKPDSLMTLDCVKVYM